jgi:hypothetical protein
MITEKLGDIVVVIKKEASLLKSEQSFFVLRISLKITYCCSDNQDTNASRSSPDTF